jgi:ArsR family transcriptional regulator, arsenate/arsenite/antimonite-responsive transcriptional repressor / arsenate reductase (thioredoxin)
VTPADPSVVSRARIHAALGDPARLTIIDALRTGDASPGEIAERLRLPSNLVAHHLKVLQDAGLVARNRSEGDARRTYVHLVPETLAAVNFAPLPPVERVVFVCTRNSARSQLAAALWAGHSSVPTASAGTEPARRIHPRATAVARRHGLRLLSRTTADVADVLHDGDLVVAVCDTAHEQLPHDPARLHWSVPDPAPADSDAAFDATYIDLSGRISRLAPLLDADRASGYTF